jgi:hypothetical protein
MARRSCYTAFVASSGHRDVDYHEGQDATERFQGAMNRLLKVSKEELAKREAAYQKSRARQRRPGPRRRTSR